MSDNIRNLNLYHKCRKVFGKNLILFLPTFSILIYCIENKTYDKGLKYIKSFKFDELQNSFITKAYKAEYSKYNEKDK